MVKPSKPSKPLANRKFSIFTAIIIVVAVVVTAISATGCSKNSYKEGDAKKGISGRQEVTVDANYSATIDYDYSKLYFEIIAIDKDTQTSQVFQVNINTTVSINDNVSFVIEGFVPDFVIGEDGKIASKTDNLSNPAVKVIIYRDGEPTFDSWLFQLYPDIHPFVDANFHILYADTLVEKDADEVDDMDDMGSTDDER